MWRHFVGRLAAHAAPAEVQLVQALPTPPVTRHVVEDYGKRMARACAHLPVLSLTLYNPLRATSAL